MDVWESGRQELNEALRGICDRIGANLAAGNNINLRNMIVTDIPARTRPREQRLYSTGQA